MTTEQMTETVAGLVFLILFPFLMIFDGFVFQHLWAWFVVILGGPQIGLAHAIGLLTFIGWATSHIIVGKVPVSTIWIFHITGPAMALLTGYIVHCIMGG